jgi:hypothetical protein
MLYTIASIEGLVDQRTYFGKTIASKDMSGYYLLKNGEFAYNKSYSKGIQLVPSNDWTNMTKVHYPHFTSVLL